MSLNLGSLVVDLDKLDVAEESTRSVSDLQRKQFTRRTSLVQDLQDQAGVGGDQAGEAAGRRKLLVV